MKRRLGIALRSATVAVAFVARSDHDAGAQERMVVSRSLGCFVAHPVSGFDIAVVFKK